MAANLAELEAEALRLDPDDRAALAQTLIESLAPPADPIQELWLTEAERRNRELTEGRSEPRTLDEVLRRATAELA